MEEIKNRSYENPARDGFLAVGTQSQIEQNDSFYSSQQNTGKKISIQQQRAAKISNRISNKKEDDQRFSNLPERYENQENDPEQSTIRYLKTKRKGKCSRRCKVFTQLLCRWMTCRCTDPSQKVRVKKYEPRKLNQGLLSVIPLKRQDRAESGSQNDEPRTFCNHSSLALLEKNHIGLIKHQSVDEIDREYQVQLELPELQGSQGTIIEKNYLSRNLRLKYDSFGNSATKVTISKALRKKDKGSTPKASECHSSFRQGRNETIKKELDLGSPSFIENDNIKIAKGGNFHPKVNKIVQEWMEMEEGEEFSEAQGSTSFESSIERDLKILIRRQHSPDEPMLLYSQSFKDIIGRTATTGMLITHDFPIVAENQCEIVYEDKQFKAKPTFNFNKVRLYISLIKTFKVKKRAVSNIKFDELLITAKANLYNMAEVKGAKINSKIWNPTEDQILLENLQKLNFCAIALKINEHNQNGRTKAENVKDSGPLGPKSPEDCKRRADFLKKTRKIGQFTKEEDDKILMGYNKFHAKWGLIARKYLPGRNGKQIRERHVPPNHYSLDTLTTCANYKTKSHPMRHKTRTSLLMKMPSWFKKLTLLTNKWDDVLKDDFEGKTKIELKQRYRELDSAANQYIGLQENKELERILDEVNFMAQQEEMEFERSNDQMMFSMNAY
ncbi:unnamed protein product [Moneuplotes crassus]|uniref:Uncharacterized protein n=1 Tax=Euplotes crassus TaxID=5936 RepID=A0AAD2D6R4_EUPCR|nr:unnamed protein product [Moneuplotes crassus]